MLMSMNGDVRVSGAARQLERDAGTYVSLVLALKHLKPEEVDFHYGPGFNAIRSPRIPTLKALHAAATDFAKDLRNERVGILSESEAGRRNKLIRRAQHLANLTTVITAANKMSMKDEVLFLYGLELPRGDQTSVNAHGYLTKAYQYLGEDAGKPDDISSYIARFSIKYSARESFVINSINECRVIAEQISDESFPTNSAEISLEWNGEIPSARHSYLGAGKSLVEINMNSTALPIDTISMICHETYLGHHQQFMTYDAHQNHNIEDRMFLTRSDHSIRGEMNASDYRFTIRNYDMFSDFIRNSINKNINDTEIYKYRCISMIMNRLHRMSIQIAIDYYDEKIPRNIAETILRNEYASPDPAGLLNSVEKTGSYIIGYMDGIAPPSGLNDLDFDAEISRCDAAILGND